MWRSSASVAAEAVLCLDGGMSESPRDESAPIGQIPERNVVPHQPTAEVAVVDSVREEIIRAIEADETKFGDVWKRTQMGQSSDEIRQAHGLEHGNYVWNHLRIAKAIIEGDIPAAPTVAITAERKLRKMLTIGAFSPAAEKVLRERLTLLEANAANPGAIAAEDKEAKDATERAEASAVTGIYVYSLPHYIRYPYDTESGRTLFKVGKADRDVIRRFRDQTRTTALPEDPVLLRVYETGDASAGEKERMFHGLLEAADHDRSKARTGGTEWFLTSLKFLDKIASSFGMPVRDVVALADEA
jgi:hypothetical protein